MPPKNMISVMRKIHIPRVEAFFCCSAVSNCSRRARLSTCAWLANLDLLSDYLAVIVGYLSDDRSLVEIVDRPRRIRLPFQTAVAPWIRGRYLPPAQRPDEVQHRHHIPHREHRRTGGREHVQNL